MHTRQPTDATQFQDHAATTTAAHGTQTAHRHKTHGDKSGLTQKKYRLAVISSATFLVLIAAALVVCL